MQAQPLVRPSTQQIPPRAGLILPFGHRLAYWQFRDCMAEDIRGKRVHPTPERIVQHAAAVYGINTADAAEWTERLMFHLQRDLRDPVVRQAE
jgi:hypothetical protein